MGARTQTCPHKSLFDATRMVALWTAVACALVLTAANVWAQQPSDVDVARITQLGARVRSMPAAEATRPEARAGACASISAARYDDAGALAAYRELVARAPNVADGHLGLGVLLVKLGGDKLTEGVRELERAIALNPDAYEARVTLGRTLIQQGQPAAAIEHLRRAA